MKKTDLRIWTILDIINWGREFFEKKQIESARLNIELLLSYALSLSRIALYSRFDQPLNRKELDLIREMVLRRAKHEPLQYIIGQTEFYGLNIALDGSVLIPRPETEEMVDFVIKSYTGLKAPNEILDIGTGSGCIALAMASQFDSTRVTGVDISKPAVERAKQNAELNAISNAEFYKYDIMSSVPQKKFDLIVSNPPYIPADQMSELAPDVALFEPLTALTDSRDGLSFYRRFAEIFPEILAPNGSFFLEIGYGEAEAIVAIFAEKSIRAEIKKDINNIDRVCFSLGN
jgi:release factor glutamine methyltransferase